MGAIANNIYNQMAQAQQKNKSVPKAKQQAWWEKWNILPTVGGILGAVGGSFIAPGAGTIGGGALGAGAGEGLEQYLTGKFNPLGLATEAGLGGLGGIGGRLFGAGRAATQAAKGAGKEAVGEASRGLLQNVGAGMRRAVLKPQAAGAFWTEQQAKQTGALAESALRGAPRTIAEKTPNEIRSLSAQAKNIVKSSGFAVDEPTLKARLYSGAAKTTEFNQFDKASVKYLDTELNDLFAKMGGKIENLNDFKLDLGKELGKAFDIRNGVRDGVLSSKEAAKLAVWDQLDDIISGAAPEAKDLTSRISQLIAGSSGVQKAAEEGVRIPMPFAGRMRLPDVMGRPLQAGMERLGGGLEGVGALGNKSAVTIPSPLGRATRATLGQLSPRALTTGAAVQPKTENPMETESLIPSPLGTQGLSSTETTQQQPLITREQAMAALVAGAKPSVVNALYNIGGPEALEKSTSSGGGDFISNSITTLEEVMNSTGILGYGPIQGRVFELQANQGKGWGLPADIIMLNQKYKMLKLNILRAYQGARISDADYALANEYTPGIADTDESARAKLSVLYTILNKINSRGSTTTGSVPGWTSYSPNE